MQAPLKIHPEAVYDAASLCLAGFSLGTLAKARRAGRLRFAKHGSRIIYRGAWLIEWLEAEADAGAESLAGGQQR